MPEKIYEGITESAAKRIEDAVRKIEEFPLVRQRQRRMYPASVIAVFRGKLDSSSSSGSRASNTVAMGSFGTVSRYNPNDDTDTGINDQVKFVIASGTVGKWYYYTTVGDHYEAIGGQC